MAGLLLGGGCWPEQGRVRAELQLTGGQELYAAVGIVA